MYLCYIDESGTPDVPGNTSHFVLAGVSLPIWHWVDADREISRILGRFDLAGQELHTAWLLRPYLEQSRIASFADLARPARRSAVQRARTEHLLKLQRAKGNRKAYQQARKNYRHTDAYIHLTIDECRQLVLEIAISVGRWGFARLFAECVNKIHFDPSRTSRTIEEQSFEQIVSRFERFLSNISRDEAQRTHGLLVHDNNETVARRHTALMRHFHSQGTLWTGIEHIIETPLFVDSKLTSMVQVADLCAYALRRYVENQETDLFERVFQRADRVGARTVGVRHFAGLACDCQICATHA